MILFSTLWTATLSVLSSGVGEFGTEDSSETVSSASDYWTKEVRKNFKSLF